MSSKDFFTDRYFLQLAFFRYARLMTPRMPMKLTAIPTSTITIRPLTLDVMPRLRKLITKPSNVINNSE